MRWRLLSAREQTLGLLARRDEQAADLDALTQLAELLDEDRRRADVAWRRSILAMRVANGPVAENTARHAIGCAKRAGDDTLRLDSLRVLAWAQVLHGDIAAGQQLARQGLVEASCLGLRRVESFLLRVLGIAAEMQSDIVGMLELHRQALDLFRETGDRVSEAVGLSNIGRGLMKLGDLTASRRYFSDALRMLRVNGDRVGESLALCSLSGLTQWQGDDTGALALARQALEISVAAQARDFEVFALQRLGAQPQHPGTHAAPGLPAEHPVPPRDRGRVVQA